MSQNGLRVHGLPRPAMVVCPPRSVNQVLQQGATLLTKTSKREQEYQKVDTHVGEMDELENFPPQEVG